MYTPSIQQNTVYHEPAHHYIKASHGQVGQIGLGIVVIVSQTL